MKGRDKHTAGAVEPMAGNMMSTQKVLQSSTYSTLYRALPKE
jgi:hypothetical protein